MFCKDCADWKRTKGRLGSCYSPKWKCGYHYEERDISDDEILVEDDEGWGCLTGPLFGCIHFREKHTHSED